MDRLKFEAIRAQFEAAGGYLRCDDINDPEAPVWLSLLGAERTVPRRHAPAAMTEMLAEGARAVGEACGHNLMTEQQAADAARAAIEAARKGGPPDETPA